jgi:hypothetical protein
MENYKILNSRNGIVVSADAPLFSGVYSAPKILSNSGVVSSFLMSGIARARNRRPQALGTNIALSGLIREDSTARNL